MSEQDAREERAQIGVKQGECGATDGVSLCTQPTGHGPVHWDRHLQHEWSEEEEIDDAEATGEGVFTYFPPESGMDDRAAMDNGIVG
jgi:hypothetical protein